MDTYATKTMRSNLSVVVFLMLISLSLINFSQSVSAWEGAVTIDDLQLKENTVTKGNGIDATITVTNHDIESHNIHFRGLLIDSNGDYYRGEDGSAELVFVDMDCCLSLYQIWEDETVTLDIEIETSNLPTGTWTSEIGVLLYDNNDEVTDSITTLEFKINPKEGDSEISGSNNILASAFGFIILIVIGILGFKHYREQDSEVEPIAVMAVPNNNVVTSNIPPNPPKINIKSPPIPYTNLPPGGEYKQVGDTTIYTSLDGRTWVQQSDGTFIEG